MAGHEGASTLLKRLASFAVVSLCVGQSFAAPAAPFTARDAFGELNGEATQCMAYYVEARQCALNSDRPDVAGKLYNAGKLSTSIATTAGKAAGMLDAAIIATVKVAVDSMMQEIGGSCVNSAITYDRYSAACKVLAEDPSARVKAIERAGSAGAWPP